MQKNQSHKILWLSWVLLMMLTLAMIRWVMPDASAKITENSTDSINADILDVKLFGFNIGEAFQALYAMGESGRRQYQQFHKREDLIFPFTYGLFLLLTLYLLIRNRIEKRLPLLLILAVPFLAMLSDLTENHHIYLLNSQFPDFESSTVIIASWANIVKWAMALLSFVLVVIFLIIALWLGISKTKR